MTVLQIFDVEHGQCALLTCPTAAGPIRLMVDCGHNASSGWTPGQHLRRLGATRLEQLVVTNYDEDHVSGFRSFAANGIGVQWTLHNGTVAPRTITQLKSEDGMGPGIEALVSWLEASARPVPGFQPTQFPGVHFESFCNAYPAFDDENNLSLVLFLNVLGFSFLFPGDMERAGFEHLLATNARFREIVSSVNVLIAAHHGRENGICEEMFTTWGCSPQIVVISDDYKQYDTQETTNWYGSRCSGLEGFRGQSRRKVLSTRCDGEITFSFANNKCIVS